MDKIYKTALLTLIAAFSIWGFSSCIKEDLSDCPSGVRVQLKLDIEASCTAPTDCYGIDAVQLYVFDAHGVFVTAAAGGAYTPGEDYFLYPDLDPGEYQFVVWTNIGDQYKASRSIAECYDQKPSLTELQLYLDLPADGCVRGNIPSLHYGRLTGAVVLKDRDHLFTVDLRPDINLLRIRVEGLPATSDDYGFRVDDDNSRYYFDNSFGSCTGLRYIRTARFEGNNLGTSMKVLRLADGRSPHFSFDNETTGEILFADNLVAIIQRAYAVAGITVDFDKTHEFDIVLRFDANMRVTVTVNGWNYTITPGQLE